MINKQTDKQYKIAVAGMGYVGMSIAVLLAQHNRVTAVDVLPEKVEKINRRRSPIQDEYIEKYLAEKPLDLTATLDGAAAYRDADFVVIAILAVWFSLILAFGSISLALMVSMFTLVIVGIMCVPADFIAGAGVVGAGLLCGGIGILFLMLTVAMGGIATPAVCRGIAGLFRKKSSAGKES